MIHGLNSWEVIIHPVGITVLSFLLPFWCPDCGNDGLAPESKERKGRTPRYWNGKVRPPGIAVLTVVLYHWVNGVRHQRSTFTDYDE